jgi:hypothetical protein
MKEPLEEPDLQTYREDVSRGVPSVNTSFLICDLLGRLQNGSSHKLVMIFSVYLRHEDLDILGDEFNILRKPKIRQAERFMLEIMPILSFSPLM